ncbi:MAG: hypothetical protein QQN63_02110 [Nitrosopumilus sp.]
MYINPEKILQMFQNMCKVHRGEMLSAYLDWEVVKVTSPHYDEPFEQWLPLLVIDFK